MIDKREVDAAIAEVITRANDYAANLTLETQLEDNRPLVKKDAIARIMQLPDEQKGSGTYSATAAEKIVELDAAYTQHRKAQSQAVVDRIIACAHYKAALLRAELMVNLCRSAEVT